MNEESLQSLYRGCGSGTGRTANVFRYLVSIAVVCFHLRVINTVFFRYVKRVEKPLLKQTLQAGFKNDWAMDKGLLCFSVGYMILEKDVISC